METKELAGKGGAYGEKIVQENRRNTMANLSQIKREKMLRFLETLKEQHSDDESLIALNQIEKELTSKKYVEIFRICSRI